MGAARLQAIALLGVVERNEDDGVTWVHSYVSDDKTLVFCVYEAPSPEAIRRAAARNALPLLRKKLRPFGSKDGVRK